MGYTPYDKSHAVWEFVYAKGVQPKLDVPHSVLLALPQPRNRPGAQLPPLIVRYLISHPSRCPFPSDVIVMSTWLPVDTNHLPPFGGILYLEPGTVKP